MKLSLPGFFERSLPLRARTAGRRRGAMLTTGAATLVLCGVLAGTLAGCGANTGADAVTAESVNGNAVSMTTYQQIVGLYKQQAARSGQSVDWQTPAGRSLLASMQASSLSFLTTALLLHEQVARQRLNVTSKDLQTQMASLASSIKTAAQQSPNDPEFHALSQALGPATTEAAHNPDLKALIAGRATMADVLVIFAYESADQQALTARAKVPTAKVRLIEVNTQKDAEALRTQAQHGADFGALAKAHSLDASSGKLGGDLGQPFFFVGQLSQLSPALDKAIFAPPASNAKTSYVIAALDTSAKSKYLLAEVTGRSTALVSTLKNAQTQSTIVSTWLGMVVKPSASIQQYVAVDPTPTPVPQQQPQG